MGFLVQLKESLHIQHRFLFPSVEQRVDLPILPDHTKLQLLLRATKLFVFSQMPLNIVLQLMELTVMDSNYRISKGVVKNDYGYYQNKEYLFVTFLIFRFNLSQQ